MNALRRTVLFAAPLLLSLALAPVQADAATSGSGRSATETRAVAEFQAVPRSGHEGQGCGHGTRGR